MGNMAAVDRLDDESKQTVAEKVAGGIAFPQNGSEMVAIEDDGEIEDLQVIDSTGEP